jgi:hypothetical protein
MRTYPKDKVPTFALSYDAMCIWVVNLYWRFLQNFPELLYLLLSLIVIIPAVHVRGHQEICWYVYSGAYTQSVGHFFGETAEFVWPYLNRLAGQTRQMSGGYRHDTMIRYAGEWNWRKIQRMGKCLIVNLHIIYLIDSLPRSSALEGRHSRPGNV